MSDQTKRQLLLSLSLSLALSVSLSPSASFALIRSLLLAATSQLKSFLSGGFGGMALVAVGHPFDLVKVRLQTQTAVNGRLPYSGAMDCFLKTARAEGVRGVYKGMSAPLIGVTPIFAVCFWGYDVAKSAIRSVRGFTSDDQLSLTEIAIAGALSAVPTTAIMAPGERIKCLLQIQDSTLGKPKYAGPGDVIRQLYREGGIGSIFRGSFITLLRDGSGSVAYFGVYEGLKRALTPAGGSQKDISPLAVFMAGGFAGMANWVLAIAPDTVKSRLQTAPEGKYSGILDVVRTMLREEGPRSLFKGVLPAMARAFPANAACFLGMEYSLALMNRLAPEW
jgi:solute carrier family 25 carnitine/acylcarnitine transporter 20/29